MTSPKVRLGMKLFADSRLSFNGTTSCASCHRPELAFTDGKPHAVGATGELHRRSAMTLINVAYSSRLGWADRSTRSIEAQIRKAFYNTAPVELGWPGHRDAILTGLDEDPELKRDFDDAFPGDPKAVSEGNVIKAIASYVRTLIEADSAYDRWIYFDDPSSLSGAARIGMRLFFSQQIGCANCHDGINFDGPAALAGQRAPEPRYANTGLASKADEGLSEQTRRRSDRGRFRVPTLRNIAATAPYMHDGRFQSLREVIDHYELMGRRAKASPLLDPRLTHFELTLVERQALLAFLEAL